MIICFKNYHGDQKMYWYDWMGFGSMILTLLSAAGAGIAKLLEVVG